MGMHRDPAITPRGCFMWWSEWACGHVHGGLRPSTLGPQYRSIADDHCARRRDLLLWDQYQAAPLHRSPAAQSSASRASRVSSLRVAGILAVLAVR